MLFNKELSNAIREETKPAFESGKMDSEYIHNNCPRLDSLFWEILRLVEGAASMRSITKTAHLSGKTLQKGNWLLVPFRSLHSNEQVWGNDPWRFDPERFLREKNLKNNPSFRPFGGGHSYCPGRFLARREVCWFIATFLHHFNVDLAPGPMGESQSFPRIDPTPSIGVNGPVESMDVLVDVRKFC